MRIMWSFLGYMGAYVPMVILLKEARVPPLQILAGSSLGCLLTLLLVFTLNGWWRHLQLFAPLPPLPPEPVLAPEGPFRSLPPIPREQKTSPWRRFLSQPLDPAVGSGLATAGIIITTTLGLALAGASAVFMSVLMKAGTLVMAPIIDRLTRRTIRPAAKWALALALAASLTALAGKDLRASLQALAITAVYLACYAVKLRRTAARKGDISFMVTDQTVAIAGVLIGVLCAARLLPDVATGFSLLRGRLDLLLIGALSQGTGIFGCLMFLAPEEHTVCVPLNRSGSVLASLAGESLRGLWHGAWALAAGEVLAASLILAAVAVLTIPARAARAVLSAGAWLLPAPPCSAVYLGCPSPPSPVSVAPPATPLS